MGKRGIVAESIGCNGDWTGREGKKGACGACCVAYSEHWISEFAACSAMLDAMGVMSDDERAADPDANWREQLRVAERIQDDAEDGKISIADVKRLAELVTSLHDHIATGGKAPSAMHIFAKAPHACETSDCVCGDEDPNPALVVTEGAENDAAPYGGS